MPRTYNPANVPAPQGAYSHVAEVGPGEKIIYIAGQVGVDADGNIPADITGQAELVYGHIIGILEDAGMGLENVVKMTTFLTDPNDSAAFREVRERMMGDAKPPNTLLYISRLASPEFKLEIEAVAAG